MRVAPIIFALCLAGCATEREVQQYEKDTKSWQTGTQESSDSWSRATGGSYRGGGIGPAPQDPRGKFQFN